MSTDTTKCLDEQNIEQLEAVANTIRHLSIDGVQRANSGHPGLPLGCAEIGAYLFGRALNHSPKNPQWLNRDRFILSAGHGCMLLYSCLHLAGFDVPLEDLKQFRQWKSKTPGHPEYRDTPGVETTTGPLGQGVACAVGQALGLKILAQKFNRESFTLFDSKVVALCGDGCIMEGISSEASSLAGHLGLNNLILFYDSNKICLDGPLSESCSEDTKKRYEAYGWKVYEVDGHSISEIDAVYSALQHEQKAPTLIISHTIIGKGSPNKAATHKVHGAPLGEEEVKLTKEALGLPVEDFYISRHVENYFSKKIEDDTAKESVWNSLLDEYSKKYPEEHKELMDMQVQDLPHDFEKSLQEIKMKTPLAGRSASNAVIQYIADKLPQIYGGSADLSCSDSTMINEKGVIAPHSFKGRNIKYGVREFAMAAMATGLSQTQCIVPFCGTFLTFSDYMRNAIRLAALSHVQVIYQFTHDSILLGEDGPTHQPVEHYMALRAIPNLHVIRPADNNEVKMAWLAALKYTNGPTALILTRQNLPELEETHLPYAEGLGRGAYIVRKEKGKADYTLIATGSELKLALDVADELQKLGKNVRVISMPCWELFEQQDESYKEEILGGDIGRRVSIEAGSPQGWYKYIGRKGIAIAVEGFGASAPGSVLAKEYGFTVDDILERLMNEVHS